MVDMANFEIATRILLRDVDGPNKNLREIAEADLEKLDKIKREYDRFMGELKEHKDKALENFKNEKQPNRSEPMSDAVTQGITDFETSLEEHFKKMEKITVGKISVIDDHREGESSKITLLRFNQTLEFLHTQAENFNLLVQEIIARDKKTKDDVAKQLEGADKKSVEDSSYRLKFEQLLSNGTLFDWLSRAKEISNSQPNNFEFICECLKKMELVSDFSVEDVLSGKVNGYIEEQIQQYESDKQTENSKFFLWKSNNKIHQYKHNIYILKQIGHIFDQSIKEHIPRIQNIVASMQIRHRDIEAYRKQIEETNKHLHSTDVTRGKISEPKKKLPPDVEEKWTSYRE